MSTENEYLKKHLEMCKHFENTLEKSRGRGGKVTFLSKTFVSVVLDKICMRMKNAIVSQIGDKKFGLLVDTTTDISSKHQMSIIVRYVSEENHVLERTLIFCEIDDTTGKGIFDKIESSLNSVGLRIQNIAGFSFDGAANMRSENKGVSHFIHKINPESVYTYCFSHRIQIGLKKAIAHTFQIKLLTQLTEDTAVFLRGSYKRTHIWAEVARTAPNYNSKTRLKLLGTTRWRQDSVANIIKTELHFFVVLRTMIEVCNLPGLDGKSLAAACEILNTWHKYENILCIYMLYKVFSKLVAVTDFLQNLGLDLIGAMNSIKKFHRELFQIQDEFDQIIEEADELIMKVNNLIMSDNYIQTRNTRFVIKTFTGEEKEEIVSNVRNEFKSYIDTLRDQIKKLFLNEFEHNDLIYKEISYLDMRFLKNMRSSNASNISLRKLCSCIGMLDEEQSAISELKALAIAFLDDERSELLSTFHANITSLHSRSFDTNIDHSNPTSEPNIYDNGDENAEPYPLASDSLLDSEDFEEAETVDYVPNTLQKCCCIECILKYIAADRERREKFQNIYKIYNYVATLPSTEVKCERDFSKLKLIKTRLRTNLVEHRLENLMIIALECDILQDIELDDIIDDVSSSTKLLSQKLGLKNVNC